MSLQWESLSKMVRDSYKYDDDSVYMFKNMVKKLEILRFDSKNIVKNLGIVQFDYKNIEDPYVIYDFLFDKIIKQTINIERSHGYLGFNIKFWYEKGYDVNLGISQKRALSCNLHMFNSGMSIKILNCSILLQLLLIQRLDKNISDILEDHIYTYRNDKGLYEKISMQELVGNNEGETFKSISKSVRFSNWWDDVYRLTSNIVSSLDEIYYKNVITYKPTVKLNVNICKNACSAGSRESKKPDKHEEYIYISKKYNIYNR